MNMTQTTHDPAKKRIVILGGGFGGAYCAQRLEDMAERMNAEIVLMDRRNYFIFYPLLVEAGTGALEPRHAVVSIRSFLKRTNFICAEALEIDTAAQEVVYRIAAEEGNRRLSYDHLVLSLGSVTRMFNIPGLKEYAFQLKSIGDTVGLRDRAIQMMETAEQMEDEGLRREYLHFVFVGASYTGVEAAGEFHAFMTEAARRFERVTSRDIQVTLVEFADRILPTLDEKLANYALNELQNRRVSVRLKTTIKELTPDTATLTDGTVLRTRTVVWTAGIAPPPFIEQLPFEKQRGYVVTDRALRVAGQKNVWAIGDCAVNPDDKGNPYPATAQHASRQGKHLAKNLARVFAGEEPLPCNIKTQGSLAAFGCYHAVADVFGFRISGFPAWFLWRSVYLMKMPGLARKMRVMLDWTAELFFRRDIVQLGIHRLTGRAEGATPGRIADAESLEEAGSPTKKAPAGSEQPATQSPATL